ncbi:hypothetical protein ABT173_37090 [Streptomyces sp. NPDC001795]|uniref:hypothetical protein n=1 Tax=Streptomyces sp. NPDC001795 TaxID=3154525 RepID=UPI00332CFB43
MIALILAPIKGYPMLDIGFSVQAVGGFALMSLASAMSERNKEQVLRNDPVAVMRSRAMEEAVASVMGGMLVARGEAIAVLTTTPEMAGTGRAIVTPGGPLIFELDSGNSHRFEREFIKSVKPVEHEDAPTGTLMIEFKPPNLIFGISITPTEDEREKWLALAPKESSPS